MSVSELCPTCNGSGYVTTSAVNALPSSSTAAHFHDDDDPHGAKIVIPHSTGFYDSTGENADKEGELSSDLSLQREYLIMFLLQRLCSHVDPTPRSFLTNCASLYRMGLLSSVQRFLQPQFLPMDSKKMRGIQEFILQNVAKSRRTPTKALMAPPVTTTTESKSVSLVVRTRLQEPPVVSVHPDLSLPGSLPGDSPGTGSDSRHSLAAQSLSQMTRSRYAADFEEIKVVGKGAFGKVYMCRHNLDKQLYAVKKCVFAHKGLRSPVGRSLLEEVRLLAKLSDHPNIMKYYSCWLEPVLPEFGLHGGAEGGFDGGIGGVFTGAVSPGVIRGSSAFSSSRPSLVSVASSSYSQNVGVTQSGMKMQVIGIPEEGEEDASEPWTISLSNNTVDGSGTPIVSSRPVESSLGYASNVSLDRCRMSEGDVTVDAEMYAKSLLNPEGFGRMHLPHPLVHSKLTSPSDTRSTRSRPSDRTESSTDSDSDSSDSSGSDSTSDSSQSSDSSSDSSAGRSHRPSRLRRSASGPSQSHTDFAMKAEEGSSEQESVHHHSVGFDVSWKEEKRETDAQGKRSYVEEFMILTENLRYKIALYIHTELCNGSLRTVLSERKQQVERQEKLVKRVSMINTDGDDIKRDGECKLRADSNAVMGPWNWKLCCNLRRWSLHVCRETNMVLLVHLLRGLQHLHSVGYVHRDIKPDNLLISLDPVFHVIAPELQANMPPSGSSMESPRVHEVSTDRSTSTSIMSEGPAETRLPGSLPVLEVGQVEELDEQTGHVDESVIVTEDSTATEVTDPPNQLGRVWSDMSVHVPRPPQLRGSQSEQMLRSRGIVPTMPVPDPRASKGFFCRRWKGASIPAQPSFPQFSDLDVSMLGEDRWKSLLSRACPIPFPYVVKLADFGLCCPLQSQSNDPTKRAKKPTKPVGTLTYSAPEQLACQPVDDKADIFSAGMILFELCVPFRTGMERMLGFEGVRKGQFPPGFEMWFPLETKILREMLCVDPKQRPSATELLSRKEINQFLPDNLLWSPHAKTEE